MSRTYKTYKIGEITVHEPDITNEENQRRWDEINNLIWEILQRQNIEQSA
jgi:hypothetical protein